MNRKWWWISVLLVAAVLLLSPAVWADDSDPLPMPKGTPRQRALSAYNEGVEIVRDKHHAAGQGKVERALAAKLERIIPGADARDEYNGLAAQCE